MSMLVTCPNCGPREVSELRCAGESAQRPLEPPTQRELHDTSTCATIKAKTQRHQPTARPAGDRARSGALEADESEA